MLVRSERPHEVTRICRALPGYEDLAMSTDVKPPQGRHRAELSARPATPPLALAMLLAGAGAVLAAVAVLWQVA
jgi:hypothetical protein